MSTKKINFITLGCSKNLVDSERLMGQLKANNLEIVHESNEITPVVVINTCGFIKDAKEESIDTILRFAKLRKGGKIEKLYVMGCLSERYKDSLREEIPEVDEFFGQAEMENIIKELGADYRKELIGERLLTTPKHFAYLKISEGCDRSCSFCAIPLIRGKHKSISIDSLVIEAKKLVEAGVKELILIAQDLTYYGVDLYGEKKLVDLLKQLSDIEGLKWIRLHYAYPTQFQDEVLELMKERKNICHYVDIPLQHISDSILKSMKRGHTNETTRALIKKFREFVPDISIRTTLIVGYPGETKKDFEALKEFVIESEFDKMGVFTYSPEENTSAFELKDSVSEKEKQERANILMEIQQEISLRKNEKKVGKIFEAVIDRIEGEYFVGRTQYDSPEVDNEVLIKASITTCSVGNFYDVKIISADAFDLYGEIVD